MSRLTEYQINALRDLATLWSGERFSLVGAAGLTCQMAGFLRQTNDLDIAIALSQDALPSGLGRLPGWDRHPRRDHEWRAPGGVRIDLIPAGPELLAAGEIAWPTGHRMNLLGFRHAFDQATRLALAPDLSVGVASIATIALLKIVAYQESPHDRIRDLGDLAFILEHYIGDDEERRYSDPVLSASVAYEQVDSFVLGRDLAAMVDDREAGSIQRFIQMARGEIDNGRTEAILRQEAPISWRREVDGLHGRIAALEQGLRSS